MSARQPTALDKKGEVPINRLLLAFVVCAMLGLLNLSSEAQEPETPTTADKNISEERLGPIPSPILTVVMSADCCHIDHVTKRGEKMLIVIDGQTERWSIWLSKMVFSTA